MLRIRARAVFGTNNSNSFVGFVSATGASSAPSHVVLKCPTRFISSSHPRLTVGVPTLGLLQRSGGVTNSSSSSSDVKSGSSRKGGRSFESSDPLSSTSSSAPNHEEGHGEGGFSSSAASSSTRVDETSAATAHIHSLSGVPGHKGTMAAFATMRLRRVAASEELSTMRKEMISELGDRAGNPTDDEVKTWKAAKVKAEADETFRRQRQARDAFVREILGPATTPSASTSSASFRKEAGDGDEGGQQPNVSVTGKTKYVLHGSDGSIDGGVNHGRLWTPKDGVAPSGFVPPEEGRAATGASTPTSSTKPKVAVNSQEGMHVLNFPNEETDERLQEAARKYQTSHLTSYGMAEMQHSGKKLMLRIAIAAIFLLLVPLVVDPMQSIGDEHGDEALKERVRQQQEENVRLALLARENQKGMGAQLLKTSTKSDDEKDGVASAGESVLSSKGESDADDDEDNFYSSDGGGGASVGPSFLMNFNPVMSMFSVIHYYYLVYSNVQSGREENYAYGDKAKAKERREQARDLLGSMKYGVEANRPESERRN